MVKEKHLKGLIHLALVGAAILELLDTTTRKRKLLVGACAGWHLHAFIYHIVYEK